MFGKALFCSLLVFVISPVYAGNYNDLAKQCFKVVQDFYDWYAPRSTTKEFATVKTVLRERKQLFSQKLIDSLMEDASVQEAAPDEITGLDFDPFLYSQDPDPKYVVRKVTRSKNKCLVEVSPESTDKSIAIPVVTAELIVNGNSTKFTNFYYGTSKNKTEGNLLGILANYSKERKQQSHNHETIHGGKGERGRR